VDYSTKIKGKDMKNGIVYIAFSNISKKVSDNDYYIKEAIFSAKSIKKIHPDLSITLFSDKNLNERCFDHVEIVPINSIRVKQNFLWDSPYNNTLYLDSDTGIVGPIDELFGLMDRFDMAATFDMMRKDQKKAKIYPDYAVIPDGFSEFAGGVILFKKSDEVRDFFGVWRKNYKIWCDLSGKKNDQPSFRVSLWQCADLKLYVLPPEYNIRTKKYDNIVPRIYHHHEMFRKGIVK